MCARLCGVVRDVRDVGGQVNAHQGFLCPCETLSEIAPDNTTIQRAWHARRGFRWVKRGGRAAPAGGGGGGRAETSRRNAREQKGWISSRHWNLANSRGMLRHTPAPSLCLRVYVSAVRGNAWRGRGGPPFSQSQTSVSCLRDFHPSFLFPLPFFYHLPISAIRSLKIFPLYINFRILIIFWLNCLPREKEESVYFISREKWK